VTAETAPDWIAAGAVACAMGTGLTAGDRDTVLKRAAALLTRLAEPPVA
jgi:2-dehydro-3-deoxyphosphogluconate aldolase / (4S)-4-hydroxy-2-oxoglutarate aldolase